MFICIIRLTKPQSENLSVIKNGVWNYHVLFHNCGSLPLLMSSSFVRLDEAIRFMSDISFFCYCRLSKAL